MKVAVAQLDPVVGAFENNVQKIKEAYQRACAQSARLLITPELGICGYPPHDLVERPEMFEHCDRALSELQKLTQGQSCALAVGHVGRTRGDQGREAQNCVSILEGGKLVFSQAKTLLPTYDVFDEARYFEPAQKVELWKCDGHPVAIAICEDLWAKDPSFGRRLYGNDPVEQYKKGGAQLVLSLSASPYEMGKRDRREQLHGEIAKRLDAPLIYVNQVGATDEILFDGGSFCLDRDGSLKARLPFFKNSFAIIDVDWGRSPNSVLPPATEREDQAPEEIEILHRALVVGIREYFARTGFKTAILGLSGGIDSALVAALATQALGSENVMGVAMPSQYSSAHSLADAEQLARNLSIRFEVSPIKFFYSAVVRGLAEGRGGTLADIALENLQARLRGLTLLTLSNHYRALVLTTGNKSELATGYCTLYGDMAGAICPIGDLYKTTVYELARYINSRHAGLIPESTMTKPPSAELKPDQKDQDTLPPYEDLDALLRLYVDEQLSIAEIETALAQTGSSKKNPAWIQEILRRTEVNEFKRRQAAPVLKVSNKAFGIGRRIPTAKSWPI